MSRQLRDQRIRHRIPIYFMESPTADAENASSNDPSIYYKLLDVGEDGKFSYRGRSITVNIDTLIDIDILGHGNFGNVMLAEVKDDPDKIKMAVKRLSLLRSTNNPNEYSTETDLRTIRTVGSGLNPHVTEFFTAFVDNEKKQLLICMEVCETSMEKFYRSMHQLKETEHLDLLLKRMINHIADALMFLKTKNILHRDVKPSNILINQNPIIFKLCDFGICGTLIDSVTGTMMKGTQIYLAPERIDAKLSPKGYGVRSDMWALGLSAVEITINKHPFHKMEAIAILNIVKTWVPELPPNLSPELEQLIIWLLKEQQADRPENYDAILASPAMLSLPKEITDEEAKMARKVIEYIPQTLENN